MASAKEFWARFEAELRRGGAQDVERVRAPHPSLAGARRSRGVPRGQTEDWRFPPAQDGSGMHVQRFGAVWRAHIDDVHPRVSIIGHFTEDVLPHLAGEFLRRWRR